MRTLVVTHTCPWPEASGGKVRAARTIEALARFGPVDVVAIVQPPNVGRCEQPASVVIGDLVTMARPPRVGGARARVRWLAANDRPWIRSGDHGRLRDEFRALLQPDRYDLIWLGGTEGYVALGDLLPTGVPVVANLDDLEDDKIRAQLEGDRAARSPASSVADRARASGSRWLDRIDLRRWRTLHREMSDDLDRLVVCSESDRDRLASIGAVGAAVVPNVYPAPARPLGRDTVGAPPTLSLVGTLHYAPNVDAARFMVREVLPIVRRTRPDVRLRLVGQRSPATDELVSEPGVEATGFVENLDVELARADVAVVPIRVGSGTRIKILEAFAHRIPVVSTSVGADGLDVNDRNELLIADDADGFAAACIELVNDVELRRSLTEAGQRRWAESYDSDAFARALADVVADVSGPVSGGR